MHVVNRASRGFLPIRERVTEPPVVRGCSRFTVLHAFSIDVAGGREGRASSILHLRHTCRSCALDGDLDNALVVLDTYLVASSCPLR